jgi:hypothetical protein
MYGWRAPWYVSHCWWLGIELIGIVHIHHVQYVCNRRHTLRDRKAHVGAHSGADIQGNESKRLL